MDGHHLSLANPLKRLIQRYSHINWALLDQALVSGTNFTAGILLVRFLGIAEYGQFVLAWLTVQFCMSLQNALVVAPMFSLAPQMPAAEKRLYYTATFWLQLALALLTLAVFLLGFVLLPQGLKPDWLTFDMLLPLVACVVLVQVQDYIRRNLCSRGMFDKSFYMDLLAYGAQLPLILLVLTAYPSFEAALMVIVGTMSVSILLGLRLLDLASPFKANVVQVGLRHWRSSKWLLGSAILQYLAGNYFFMVAGALFGPALVGAIRAAQNLVGLSHILFQGFENIVPGQASRRYHEGGTAALVGYLKKSGVFIIGGTALIALTAAVLAEPLLGLLYGSPDPNSITAMFWFVPLYTLIAVALPLRSGLRSLERTHPIFIAYALNTVLSLSSAHYLVSHYQATGVMAGMVAVELIMNIILFTALRRELRAAERNAPPLGKIVAN